jgi:hypothetical protein
MNNLEKVLRSKTVGLFSEKWYEETTLELMKVENKTRGYVYFIGTYRGSDIKIGMSSNLTSRLKNLKSGFSDGLILLGFIFCDDFKKKETEMHSLFQERNVTGEWFNISKSQAFEVIKKHNGTIVNKFFINKSSVLDGLPFGFSETNSSTTDHFYIDFFKYCEETIKVNEKITNSKFRDNIRNLKKEYESLSDKKIFMKIRDFAEINNYKIRPISSNGKRSFILFS